MSFVYDGSSLNNAKTDLINIPFGADPTKYIQAVADWNPLATAVLDLRAGVINNLFLGITPQAVSPTIPTGGTDHYLWTDSSNDHLMFFNGTLDIDLSTGGVTATLNDVYLAGVAGQQIVQLDTTNLGITLEDDPAFINGPLFAIKSSAGALNYFSIDGDGTGNIILNTDNLSAANIITTGTATIASTSSASFDGSEVFLGTDAGVTTNGVTIGHGATFVELDGTLKIPEVANGSMGADTLIGGTATISHTGITASSRIFLTPQNSSGTPGDVYVSARTPGVGFTITSTSALDTRLIAIMIVEPA